MCKQDTFPKKLILVFDVFDVFKDLQLGMVYKISEMSIC